MRGAREFTSVGVTLDKRRGLYVVLTPRLSTEKQPLSSTYWKPPWTSVTTIVAKRRWRVERRHLEHPPDFHLLNTLSHHPTPTSSSHYHPSTPVWTHFFFRIATSLSERSRCTLLPSRLLFVSFLLFQTTRDENRTTMTKPLRNGDNNSTMTMVMMMKTRTADE